MTINRSNYEVWLIDWLDGNLNDHQAEQLMLFLDENPELGEEYRELTAFSLKASSKSFPFKEQLNKSNADLPQSQFEYLCVANLENDLSTDQENELKDIIDQDPEKRRTFDLIQKTILTPPVNGYKYKNLLIKKPAAHRFIRLSVIGLSTAAAITLIVMNYFLIPRNLSEKVNDTAQNLMVDSSIKQLPTDIDSEIIIPDINTVSTNQKPGNLFAGIREDKSVITQPDLPLSESDDSLLRNTENRETELKKIPVNYTKIDLKGEIVSNTLIASNTILSIVPDEDERSNLSKFISKTFREKILKEKPSEDSPLKVYEIAEAGVTGLNKLLGWQMGLDRKTDENGELKSVYFSSRILKFNAPVKKSEPLP